LTDPRSHDDVAPDLGGELDAGLVVIAVDPGRSKCGVAVVSPRPGHPRALVHWRSVEPTLRVVERVAELTETWQPRVVLVGDGTQGRSVLRGLRFRLPEAVPVLPVPEENTSRRARERVVQDSLPRGIARLVPRGMRVPNQPWDDVVAILLAEDWFARQAVSETETAPDCP